MADPRETRRSLPKHIELDLAAALLAYVKTRKDYKLVRENHLCKANVVVAAPAHVKIHTQDDG